MQLTERFKLSKIESGDPFLPGGLNSGTDQVEEALRIAHMGAVEEHKAQTGLEERVTALEVHKIAVGTYVGDDQPYLYVSLGFTPVLVFAQHERHLTSFSIADHPIGDIEIIEGGFRARASNSGSMNKKGQEYNFAAFV